jgi:hypothetical protein
LILREALVLSEKGIKRTVLMGDGESGPRITDEGPLSVWSEEPVLPYQEEE